MTLDRVIKYTAFTIISYAILNAGFRILFAGGFSYDLLLIPIESVFFGVVFSTIALLINRKAERSAKVVCEPNEVVVKTNAANLYRGFEAVGGRLTQTNRRLIFNPHGLNLQRNDLLIELSNILALQIGRTLGVFENRLIVTCKDGNRYSFVVNDPDVWIQSINGGQLVRHFS